MQIYLPIAEMAVSAEVMLLLGACVGFLSGIFGVGGGFMATPLLIFLGIPPAIAVGTQANQLVASSMSGVLTHTRRGNVDFRMGGVMLCGGIFGSLLGIFLFRLLQHFGHIDIVIPILYVVFLGVMGITMLAESVRGFFRPAPGDDNGTTLAQHAFFQRLPYKMAFPQSRLYISALVPAAIGMVAGLLVSLMGIGGGFLLVPAMIYILGMPALLVAGTSMFQILITGIFATILQATVNGTVDAVLAALLIVGSVIGAQFGIWVSRRIRGVYSRIALSILLLCVCVLLAQELFVRPADLYTSEVMR